MATGRPQKWVTARISEPISISTAGLKLVVWDKWGKTRRGTAIVSVGGIRWYPYMAKKPYRISWDQLDKYLTS
jgi:hypothetical protein